MTTVRIKKLSGNNLCGIEDNEICNNIEFCGLIVVVSDHRGSDRLIKYWD
jgi:hypothetical protein